MQIVTDMTAVYDALVPDRAACCVWCAALLGRAWFEFTAVDGPVRTCRRCAPHVRRGAAAALVQRATARGSLVARPELDAAVTTMLNSLTGAEQGRRAS